MYVASGDGSLGNSTKSMFHTVSQEGESPARVEEVLVRAEPLFMVLNRDRGKLTV